MRRTFVAGLAAAGVLAAGPNLHAASFDLKPFIGKVTYKEHAREVIDADSRWRSDLYGFKAEVSQFAAPGVGAALEGTYWTGREKEETWGGDISQTNDLEAWGAEGSGLIGFNLPVVEYGYLTPLLGFSFRYQYFERDDFVLYGSSFPRGTVTDKCPLFNGLIGLNLDLMFEESFGLYGRFLYGYVIDSRTDNSLLGEIDGDHGNIYSLQAGIQLWDGETFGIGGGVFYEQQDLDGGSSDRGEWPENDLESLAFMMNLRFYF